MTVQSFQSSSQTISSRDLAIPDISDREFIWLTSDELTIQPSDVWKHWLFDSSSLTQLLISQCNNSFEVKVIAEEWVLIGRPEIRSHFGPLSDEHKFWSRKVQLIGDNQPWVMAHTLIPAHSLLSPLKEVQELNEKPLGEYLFSHPDLVRSGMDISRFAEDSWGRRSLFYLFAKPVMVAEFFLPELLDYISEKSLQNNS